MAKDNRPSWDQYFMTLANEVATRTTCMRRAVGAIIVKDRRILATGYNGVPTGLTHEQKEALRAYGEAMGELSPGPMEGVKSFFDKKKKKK